MYARKTWNRTQARKLSIINFGIPLNYFWDSILFLLEASLIYMFVQLIQIPWSSYIIKEEFMRIINTKQKLIVTSYQGIVINIIQIFKFMAENGGKMRMRMWKLNQKKCTRTFWQLIKTNLRILVAWIPKGEASFRQEDFIVFICIIYVQTYFTNNEMSWTELVNWNLFLNAPSIFYTFFLNVFYF